MATVEQVEERLREVAQTQARIMIDVEMYRMDIKALKERVAALENRAGTASQLAPAPVVPPVAPVGPGTSRPPSFDVYGYQIYVDDPLRAFRAGESTVARAIAKHKFDVNIGNRTVTPLDADYGAAYALSGKFAGVDRSLQKAWLMAILLDGGVNPMPPWFLTEFGAP